MSRLGDKSYDTCAPGCGCDDDQAESNDSAFFIPESEEDNGDQGL